MKEELRRKIEISKGDFQERLEYLIRDINMIEKDVINIGHDLDALEQELKNVQQSIASPAPEAKKIKDAPDSPSKPLS
ncbi:MAG TPA: hypothetical protein ENN72_01075 [Firmicutes bacterium]|nr:hypothetical protein [Bacillota bacterium]